MPLTEKGEEILAKMKAEYGADKGEQVFYASRNAGTIEGVDSADSSVGALPAGDPDMVDSAPSGPVPAPAGPMKAAGVMFLSGRIGDPSTKVLLVQRGPRGDHAGEWAFPGGKVEDGETLAGAAARETLEEIGWDVGAENLATHTRRIADGVDFTTFLFVAAADESWPVSLDLDESSAWAWFLPSELPANLHPGVPVALARLDMDELDVARAIISGDLASPQCYCGLWLFDLRITGTGSAFRPGKADGSVPDEYALRPGEHYLDPSRIDRYNGLAVIWQHPEDSMLNTDEYRDRAVGAVMLPYIDADGRRHPPDEVWGVCRIQDQDAATIMSRFQISTSPGVTMRGGETRYGRLEDGTKFLIENAAKLVDHLAVCEVGVWDKTEDPSGVNITGDPHVADETEDKAKETEAKDAARKDEGETKPTEERKDAARKDADGGEAVPKDEILDAIRGMSKRFDERMDKMDARMDAVEKRDSSKKDESEEKGKAEEMAADAAKKDADAKAEEERKDKERRDAEEKERADAKRRLDEIEAKVKDRSDSEEKELSDAQARCDSVARLWGRRAPPAMAGETAIAYRRRLAREYQDYSGEWKGQDLSAMNEGVFAVAERQIFDSARLEASNPARADPDTLRAVRDVGDGGHTIISYQGSPRAWMDGIAGHQRNHVTAFNTN